MKQLALLSSVLLLVSCGKKVEEKRILVESRFDDSKILAHQLIQDARLNALENKTRSLEQLLTAEAENLEETKKEIEQQFNAINSSLNNVQNQVSAFNNVEVLPVCNSAEYLIKINTEFYAVFMVSNNYGTYLGKLKDNASYQTTDKVGARFKIKDGEIVCQ